MPRDNIRPALVAGLFYERAPERLREQLERMFLHRLGAGRLPTPAAQGARQIVGLVCPHAGVPYSGPSASRAYAALAEDGSPATAVILAPAHYRRGAEFAVWTEGSWETPLGAVTVDDDCAAALIAAHDACAPDAAPHLGYPPHYPEHAIETQLPFLQFIFGAATPRITPVTVSTRDRATLTAVGAALGRALAGRDVVVIASCDFTHHEPQSVAAAHDHAALARIAALDVDGLVTLLAQHETMSDVLSAAVPMLAACHALGAATGEVLGYATSGDIIGDHSSVVGYGAAAVKT